MYKKCSTSKNKHIKNSGTQTVSFYYQWVQARISTSAEGTHPPWVVAN